MPRLRNVRTGVVVSVADEKASRFGAEWEPADKSDPAPAPAPVKRAARKPPAKPTK